MLLSIYNCAQRSNGMRDENKVLEENNLAYIVKATNSKLYLIA